MLLGSTKTKISAHVTCSEWHSTLVSSGTRMTFGVLFDLVQSRQPPPTKKSFDFLNQFVYSFYNSFRFNLRTTTGFGWKITMSNVKGEHEKVGIDITWCRLIIWVFAGDVKPRAVCFPHTSMSDSKCSWRKLAATFLPEEATSSNLAIWRHHTTNKAISIVYYWRSRQLHVAATD